MSDSRRSPRLGSCDTRVPAALGELLGLVPAALAEPWQNVPEDMRETGKEPFGFCSIAASRGPQAPRHSLL
jgi:hypothetical protein